MVLSHEGLEDDVDLRLVAMTMPCRHPRLHIYDMCYFIGVWDFARYPSVLLFRNRLVTHLDYLQVWLLLQRLARRWGYVLLSFLSVGLCPIVFVRRGGRASSFCLFVFQDTHVHFRPHGDTVGTSQKFRLSFVTNSCTVCNLSRWSIK